MTGEPTLAHFVERLPVIVFRLDRQLRLIYVNEGGHPHPGAAARRPDRAHRARSRRATPSSGRAFEAACQRVFATGEQQEADFIARTAQGTRHFEAHLFPEVGANGDVQSIIGVTTDRTGRRLVEDALRESEERYHALISNVKSYALFGIDLQGIATTWNEGVERLLGYSRNEFIGLTTERLFSAEDVAKGLSPARASDRRGRRQLRERSVAASERRHAVLRELRGQPRDRCRRPRHRLQRRAAGSHGLEARSAGARRAAGTRTHRAPGSRTGQPAEGRVPRHALARAALAAERHRRLGAHRPPARGRQRRAHALPSTPSSATCARRRRS